MIHQFNVNSKASCEMIDMTHEIQRLVKQTGLEEGLCTIFVPHTTAGITINENADPDVKKDMLMELGKIVPLQDSYRHSEGNSAAHIKASMMGFSQTILIQEGKLVLGTWQGIYFCEFDGPRKRQVVVRIG